MRETFPEADARTHAELDVTQPFAVETDLILHAAAWTDVDGAEADPAGAELVNVDGTRNVVAQNVPVVYYSSDTFAEKVAQKDGKIRDLKDYAAMLEQRKGCEPR